MTSASPARVTLLKLSVIFVALFNVLALLVLVRNSPLLFTVFMFVGQPLFVVAVLLLAGAVLADLKAKGLL